MRHPGVNRHVREHPRPVKKARLSGDKQQRGFREQRQHDQSAAGRSPSSVKVLEKNSIHRLSLDWKGAHEKIAQQDAAGRERERGGHQEHRALAGLNSRLAQHPHAVGNRLDTRVGAAPPLNRRAGG